MDMNTILKAVMSSDAVDEIGKSMGLEKSVAGDVLTEVLPLLMNGAKGQSKNKDTAADFLEAIMSHGEKDSSDMAKFVKNIDLDDGAKIVKHLLGSEEAASTKKVAEKSGLDAKKIATIMAIAAPIVMNQLGKNAKKSSKKADKSDIGDIVGGLMDGVDAGDVLKVAKLFLK